MKAPDIKVALDPPLTESPAVPSLNEYLCVRYEPRYVDGAMVGAKDGLTEGCNVGDNVGVDGIELG